MRSPSQVNEYLEGCPWKYYLRRIERVEPRPAAWSHQGTAFHAACEAYELSDRTMSLRDVRGTFSDEYSRLVNLSLDAEPDTDRWMTAGPEGVADIEARFQLGLEQTAGYVSWAEKAEPAIWKSDALPDCRGIEMRLTAEIGGVRVQGIIDQVVQDGPGEVRIRDLKTGSMKSRFQLETYAILVQKALTLKVERGDWYLAKTGKLSRPIVFSESMEDDVGRKYAEMDAGVKRGDFPARPGFSCRFCDVSHACTASRRK
ncbi:RecB family exonuclease [Streptomyces sp. NPDC051546]|uniref:RecB family exonuclease n=1 Tax=Streptomyces sp. NPDC051546 TaxID=3365655 RepID=UPI0037A02E1D